MKNADIQLTEKIRDELLIPKVYRSAENLHNIISLKIYNLEYINNKIFKNLLNLIDENN